MKRLLLIALALWLGRWAATRAAALAGRHWQERGPAPKDAPRAPGHMPGPFD